MHGRGVLGVREQIVSHVKRVQLGFGREHLHCRQTGTHWYPVRAEKVAKAQGMKVHEKCITHESTFIPNVNVSIYLLLGWYSQELSKHYLVAFFN
ncbi:unnamed protein product [Cuscuta campestris]|uniref:Uncharacterized protein n=1 Tax=Cuscuta campestris TaxID=132261 RepID=A0A484LJA4_9ASTE|nr:unnamed protein product [Cuscuta campestris]